MRTEAGMWTAAGASAALRPGASTCTIGAATFCAISRRRWRWCVALALLLPVAPALAGDEHAKTPEPMRTTERFGAWEMSCGAASPVTATGAQATAAPRATRHCRVTQRQAVGATGAPVFAITILPTADVKALLGVISVPLGGYLAPGIDIRIDSKPPFRLLYETCTLSGCHAGFTLDGRVRKAFESGETAVFRVWTAKGKAVNVKSPLSGFKRAVAALGRAQGAAPPPARPMGTKPPATTATKPGAGDEANKPAAPHTADAP